MKRFFLGFLFPVLLLLAACGRPQATAESIRVTVEADGVRRAVTIPAGGTVSQALEAAGIVLEQFDRVEPPGYTTLTEGAEVSVVRVTERFEIEEITVPFGRQTVRNEALPEGETRLLQPGQNGVQEITYRIVLEEGEEISRAPVKTTMLKEPQPEIVMVGTQASYAPLTIKGRLAYLSGGNAWLIEGNSGNRRPIVLTGDLDGRIFELSPDGRWLLFSRAEPDDDTVINSLWIASLSDAEREPIALRVENVVHFAAWLPEKPSLTIAFSTVEPSPAAPGWQANNDLQTVVITSAGRVLRPKRILDSNAGGQYGWWGTQYAFGGKRDRLAYIRADQIGLVDLEREEQVPLIEITPLQTLGDWAWIPGLTWGRDNQTLYFVDHGPPMGLEAPQASPVFNLAARSSLGSETLVLAEQVGMFASPAASPILPTETAEISFRVAFLSAISPLESEDSHYRLMVMDRDGSNLKVLFPLEGEPGLEPGPIRWSPDASRLAVIYRSDLWIVDADTGLGQQLTGDGQTTAVDWR